MTEAQWAACTDPARMLDFLPDNSSRRKLRLFACACCRLVWDMLAEDGYHQTMVEVAEQFADGLANRRKLARAAKVPYWGDMLIDDGSDCAEAAAEMAAARSVTPLVAKEAARQAVLARQIAFGSGYEKAADDPGPFVQRQQAHLLRDIFGPLPFRRLPAVSPAWLSWNGGTIPKLAQGIYAERAFDRLLILADALEDAGCNNTGILAHLRGTRPHARGCWPVDLLRCPA